MERMAMNGDQAVALSWKQIVPDVVASYPITPQTIIVEAFAEFVADGLVDTEYVCAESEHSAMSMCIGASAAGTRAATATASAGLAFMWEMLYIAASLRLPIVMAVANRALSGPINIHCDHSDSMGARDSGWIQIYAEDVQEAYDNSLMAFRIAENLDVRLPIMTCMDGFITTHSIENITPLDDGVVKKFVGPFKALKPLLDVQTPYTYGPFDFTDWYFEHKYSQAQAMNGVLPVIEQVQDEFTRISGRKYNIVQKYKTEDADYIAVALGSTAGTLKYVVDQLREEGHKVGAIKPRVFRPFPYLDMEEALRGAKEVAVLDRAISFGATGPMFPEVRTALFDLPDHPKVFNYIYGLGGRDVGAEDLARVYRDMIDGKSEIVNYLGVRI